MVLASISVLKEIEITLLVATSTALSRGSVATITGQSPETSPSKSSFLQPVKTTAKRRSEAKAIFNVEKGAPGRRGLYLLKVLILFILVGIKFCERSVANNYLGGLCDSTFTVENTLKFA